MGGRVRNIPGGGGYNRMIVGSVWEERGTSFRRWSSYGQSARHPRPGAVLRRRAQVDAGIGHAAQPAPVDAAEAAAAADRAAVAGGGALVRRAAFAALGGAGGRAVHERGDEPRGPAAARSGAAREAARGVFSRQPVASGRGRGGGGGEPAGGGEPRDGGGGERDLVQHELPPQDVREARDRVLRAAPGIVGAAFAA